MAIITYLIILMINYRKIIVKMVKIKKKCTPAIQGVQCTGPVYHVTMHSIYSRV